MRKNDGVILSNTYYTYKKGQPILKNINMHLKPGSITALVGENGCGKTTLLRLLSGITKPTQGKLYFNGMPLNRRNMLTYKRTLGVMPEQIIFYPREKVIDILRFFVKLRRQKIDDKLIEKTLEKVGLFGHKNEKIATLSKGLKQRLNLAQAIIHQPSVVIFDEPSNGFDYLGIELFYQTLNRLSNNGAIILLTSHLFSELWGKVDHILMMKAGEIVRQLEAKFGHGPSSQKTLFLRLAQPVNSQLTSALKKITPVIKQLEPDTLKASVSLSELEAILLTVRQMKEEIIDIQVDSVDIEMLLRNSA